MAQFMLISERQLQRKLNALFDQSFTDYLRKYRSRQSAALMKSGPQIGQICDQTGFNSPSYFAKYFKAEFGVTPKQYQKNVFVPNGSQ
jgi:AraC-like DNA-binding protein